MQIATDRPPALDHPALVIRRVDAIPTPDEDVAEAKAKAREGVDGRDKPGHATVAHGFVSLKPACEKEIAGAKKPQARRTCGGDRRRTSAPAL
jgi:hypothetical protein